MGERMNRRDAIKNTMVAMWPKSKLPTQTLAATIDRLNGSNLTLDQITALLTAHQQECEKAAWSPFPPDISRRVSAVRADTGNRQRVAATAKANASGQHYAGFVAWANAALRDRVLAAVECMDMAAVDGFVLARANSERLGMWNYAKAKLGNAETWTPERLADLQPARIVLAHCLGLGGGPEYDPQGEYPRPVRKAGTGPVPGL
jgi:hypothetical protein